MQVIVLEGVMWNNVMLLLYEYRAASTLLETQFLRNGLAIGSTSDGFLGVISCRKQSALTLIEVKLP